MPVTRTQGKTQQVVNTHVQHVVNTVKVKKPEIIEKRVEVPHVQYINKVTDVPVVVQRQVPTIQKVQKTVDVPQFQHIDRIMDLPVVKRHQEPTIQRVQKTVEVPQIQFIDKFVDAPVGVQADSEIELEATTPVAEDRTGVNLNITDATPPVADPSCRKRKGSDIIQSPRARAVTRTHDDDDRCEIFIVDIASTDEMEEDICAHAVVPARSRAQRELDDTKSGMVCVKQELKEINKMLEFLVRRERKVDSRTEVAVKKLQRLEKEWDEENDKEREASLKKALADKTKVVKLVVDKWFVEKGYGFGKVPTGEIVFIHASVMHGREVLNDRHRRVSASRERRSPCRGRV